MEWWHAQFAAFAIKYCTRNDTTQKDRLCRIFYGGHVTELSREMACCQRSLVCDKMVTGDFT